MTKPDMVAVLAEAHGACPCLRRQTHADTSFGPCANRACTCYFLGSGADACLWPGHDRIDAVVRGAWHDGGEATLRAVDAELTKRGHLRVNDVLMAASPPWLPAPPHQGLDEVIAEKFPSGFPVMKEDDDGTTSA